MPRYSSGRWPAHDYGSSQILSAWNKRQDKRGAYSDAVLNAILQRPEAVKEGTQSFEFLQRKLGPGVAQLPLLFMKWCSSRQTDTLGRASRCVKEEA